MNPAHGIFRRPAAPWRILAYLCLGLVLATPTRSQGPRQESSLQEGALRVGLPQIAFINLNENDAAAASRVFIVAIGRKRGYELRPELLIYNSLPQFEDAVRNGTIQVAIMSTWQLLETGLSEAVDISFVPSAGGVVSRRVLLLARNDGGLRSPGDLKGRSLLILRDTRTTLGRPWFETLCLANGLGPADTFLRRLEIVTRPNAAILPVYFGRYDACIVDELTYAITCELNPQLSRSLVVIAQSDPMIDSVVCLNRTGWESPRRRDDLRQGMAELHLEPSGRQILTLFRFDQLVPFAPAMLDTVRQLHARHVALQNSPGLAGASPR